ncbi:BZIP transcription factor [Pleurostoma richardsiae]|uniref:BZIP transcription factor n=1 Tax=Pleurostoma richardsiae TaxID=41990 RepID=A0AA38RL64_9PEZI|nr:BZIP transcription factor [Pleurostoma richardsiae]
MAADARAIDSLGTLADAPHDRGPSDPGVNGRSVPTPNSGGSHASPDDAATPSADGKRRRTGPGSRGVANLTPEQLAKKRANDREAQRAIRERTKLQIETLEKRIRELTSQQPYQELQVALRAKEAVEAENAEIKRRLESVMAVIQPILSSRQAEQAVYHSPSHSFASVQAPPVTLSVPNVSTPSSAASPASTDHQSSGSWQPMATSSGPSPQEQQKHAQARIQQQRHDFVHGLDFGTEKLGLEFLLDGPQRVPKIQNGSEGAQDSLQFHHVPMKHDWTGGGGQSSSSSPNAMPLSPYGQNLPSQPQYAQLEASSYNPLATFADATLSGSCSTPIKNCGPVCPLDSLLLDFLRERRQRAAEGLPTHEVVGPRYPSVSSLLNPQHSRLSHPLSKVFTDILATFPSLSGLPERVASLYVMFLLMRWQVSPTRENYDRLPPWLAPQPAQLSTAHPAWLDHLPFPAMRDRLVREHGGPREMVFDNFFIPYTRTLSLNWGYEDTDVLLQAPGDSDELLINPVFERHLRRLENWTLGAAFATAFPGLSGTYNLKM